MRSSSEGESILYVVGAASMEEVRAHLERCDAQFAPKLSARVELSSYARKIHESAVMFEAWSGARLVGLVAAYMNDPARSKGYVTNVSVEADFQAEGVAKALMAQCIRRARDGGLEKLELEVAVANARASALYRGLGFSGGTVAKGIRSMTLVLEEERASHG